MKEQKEWNKNWILLCLCVLMFCTSGAWADFTFGEPVNLGAPINTSLDDGLPAISSDGLSLYYSTNNFIGYGQHDNDIWVAKRKSTNDAWEPGTSLGPIVNSNELDVWPFISADGLTLYFYSLYFNGTSNRPGGLGGADIWNKSEMDIQGIFLAHICPKLSNSFQKRQTFNVTDGSADFNDDDIYGICNQFDASFNLVCNVGNDLYRTAQVISPAFFGDDRMVYFPGGKVVVSAQSGMGKPLIMSEIQIRFCPVIRDINFSMLERVHGSGVNIDVRVQFLYGYGKPSAFKKCPDSCRSKPFAQ